LRGHNLCQPGVVFMVIVKAYFVPDPQRDQYSYSHACCQADDIDTGINFTFQ